MGPWRRVIVGPLRNLRHLKSSCESNKRQSQRYWHFFCNGWRDAGGWWTERMSVNMPIHSCSCQTCLWLWQLFFLSRLYSVSSSCDSIRNRCLTMCYLQTQISNMLRRNLFCLLYGLKLGLSHELRLTEKSKLRTYGSKNERSDRILKRAAK